MFPRNDREKESKRVGLKRERGGNTGGGCSRPFKAKNFFFKRRKEKTREIERCGSTMEGRGKGKGVTIADQAEEENIHIHSLPGDGRKKGGMQKGFGALGET